MPPTWRKRAGETAGAAVLMLVVASGCSTHGPPAVLVHDSPRGTVSLATLPPGKLEAAQPVSLTESTVAQVLSGIMVRPRQRLLQDILAGEAPVEPALPRDAAVFLAPLVREALGLAGPDDLVRFEVRRAIDSGQEATGGALYVKGRAVVLALTRYRARSAQSWHPGKAGRNAPLAAGLRRYAITFLPRGVEVPLPADPPDELAMGEFPLLAIDFALLAKLQGLEAESAPLPPGEDTGSGRANEAPGPGDAGTLKDWIMQQDVEIEALRQEVESLRRQLEERGPGQGR